MPERIRSTIAKARAASEAGEHAEAARCYRAAGETARAADLPSELAFCLRHEAHSLLDLGESEAALEAAREAAQVYDRAESERGINYATTTRLMALAKGHLGAHDEARDHWAEARSIFDVHGVRDAVAECDTHLGSSAQNPNS